MLTYFNEFYNFYNFDFSFHWNCNQKLFWFSLNYKNENIKKGRDNLKI